MVTLFLFLINEDRTYGALRLQMPEEQFVLQAVRALRKAQCTHLSSKVHVNKGSDKKNETQSSNSC
jgi:hypothetical protein